MVPDIQNELNRKVGSAIQSLLQRNTNGEIDDAQLFIGIQAIWDSASGLVDGQLTDLLSGVLSNRDGIGIESISVCVGKGKMVGLICRRMVDGTGDVEVRVGVIGSEPKRLQLFAFTTDESGKGSVKAAAKAKQLLLNLEKDGYKKLL